MASTPSIATWPSLGPPSTMRKGARSYPLRTVASSFSRTMRLMWVLECLEWCFGFLNKYATVGYSTQSLFCQSIYHWYNHEHPVSSPNLFAELFCRPRCTGYCPGHAWGDEDRFFSLPQVKSPIIQIPVAPLSQHASIHDKPPASMVLA